MGEITEMAWNHRTECLNVKARTGSEDYSLDLYFNINVAHFQCTICKVCWVESLELIFTVSSHTAIWL